MRKLLGLMLIVMMMVLVGCGAGNNEGNTGDTNQQLNNSAVVEPDKAEADKTSATAKEEQGDVANSKETVYPLTVTDASGFELTFDQAPERIVSTSPSETEILFALGLGDKIFGVSDYDNYPEAALSKPKIGGVVKPNEEAIIATNADLVVGGISMPDDISVKFRELGMKVYKTEPADVEEILTNILQLGVITNTQVKAEEIVAQMREDIRKVTDAVATLKEEDKKKVYLEFAPGWTVGSGEFLDELLKIAGGTNIAHELAGWNKVNEEKIIQDNPDVILYAADLVDYDSGKPLEEIIKNRSGWDKIKAIQDGSLTAINGDILTRPGPRITEGLLIMVEGIYPGLVKQ
jgi:iron complex transport system substrate-binding protein